MSLTDTFLMLKPTLSPGTASGRDSTSAASFPPPLLQRPVFQFRYALPTCDVPPHNAAALTVVHLAPNHPTDLPSVSATVVTSPPSCNLPPNVLQPAATRAGLPPIPLRLPC